MSAPAEGNVRLRQATAWTAFAAAYLATYFVTTAVPTPLLWYHPLTRRFSFEVRPNDMAMDFMGRVLLSLVAGGVAALVGRAVAARLTPERAGPTLRMLGAWMVALLIFTASLYIYLLVGRSPFPVPLPPGYSPR